MQINMKSIGLFAVGIAIAVGIAGGVVAQTKQEPAAGKQAYPVTKTNAEWRKVLTPEQYSVLREAGTERAFSGKYWNNHERGIYTCAGCDQLLFDSETKFESGTGWPSFYKAINPRAIVEHRDVSFGMVRTETLCSRCGGHLGHVFDDGPRPTGLRYCMNSAALKFVPAKKQGATIMPPGGK